MVAWPRLSTSKVNTSFATFEKKSRSLSANNSCLARRSPVLTVGPLRADGQDEIWRVSVTANVPIEQFEIDGNHAVLFQRFARRQRVVWSKPFPLDGGESVLEQGF
jgi:hypothetical protein